MKKFFLTISILFSINSFANTSCNVDLRNHLVAELNVSKDLSCSLINTFTDYIQESLFLDKRVTVDAVGTFYIYHRNEGTSQNPTTGKTIPVMEADIIKFRAGSHSRTRSIDIDEDFKCDENLKLRFDAIAPQISCSASVEIVKKINLMVETYGGVRLKQLPKIN